jgi:hypothetical protein
MENLVDIDALLGTGFLLFFIFLSKINIKQDRYLKQYNLILCLVSACFFFVCLIATVVKEGMGVFSGRGPQGVKYVAAMVGDKDGAVRSAGTVQ